MLRHSSRLLKSRSGTKIGPSSVSSLEIKIEGSAVFISVSDKLLFTSGSYSLTPEAMQVLGKVAKVLNGQPEIRFMVEGHTDNKPILNKSMKNITSIENYNIEDIQKIKEEISNIKSKNKSNKQLAYNLEEIVKDEYKEDIINRITKQLKTIEDNKLTKGKFNSKKRS